MAMSSAKRLSVDAKPQARTVTFGVCATSDPRIDKPSRQRCANIAEMVADVIADEVRLPDGTPSRVVWTDVLIDGEKSADTVARQFRAAQVDAVIVAPDTWAFPQLTLMSVLAQLPADTPVNITCGNSGPKPEIGRAHV
jgi:L-fucose/D-arabinose isomerase